MSDAEMIYDATPDEAIEDAPEIALMPITTLPAMPGEVQRPQPTREEIDALKNTLKAVNRDMTDAQFKVFMAAANHLGLDPLARQIVPIFQGGRMTVQTTIDGFRLIAERTRKYRGQVGPFWCGKDGEWHDVWLSDDAPAAAKVGVIRSDFAEPMWGVARHKSYAKGGVWATMPDVMIAKVAESLALRKAFPAELSGAYTSEEMTQADQAPTAVPDDGSQPHAQQATQPHQSAAGRTQAGLPTSMPQRPPAHAQAQAQRAAGSRPAVTADEDATDDAPPMPPTDAQAKAIRRLCDALKRPVPVFTTYSDASRLIAFLSAEVKREQAEANANGHDLREAFPATSGIN